VVGYKQKRPAPLDSGGPVNYSLARDLRSTQLTRAVFFLIALRGLNFRVFRGLERCWAPRYYDHQERLGAGGFRGLRTG